MDQILVPQMKRYTLFPIQHPDLYDMYREALSAFWTPAEIDVARDRQDFELRLTESERTYIKHILAFFAGSDGLVMENLAQRFSNEVYYAEARSFYAIQICIEAIHSETYSLFIDTLIRRPDEKLYLFEALERIPTIQKKAAWTQKYIESSQSFSERLVAFACVEGLFFSGSFAAIFWLRKRGLMPSLSMANEKIAADEGLHTQFAALLYRRYVSKIPRPTLEAMMREAVQIEQEFQTEAFPCALLGLNADHMNQYIEYVCDYILTLMGEPVLYHTANPFDFMTLMALQPKTNFFENRVAQYKLATEPRSFSMNMSCIS